MRKVQRILVASVVAFVGVCRAEDGVVATTPRGSPATPPALGMRVLDGTQLSGEEFAGHPVVVLFWAAGHPASVRAIEALVVGQAAMPGVVYLGVALDADVATATQAAAAMAQQPAWEHAVNQDQPEGEVIDTRFYDQPYGIPAAWVIDPQGQVAWQGAPAELAEPLARVVSAAEPALPWSPELRAARVAWAAAVAAAGSGAEALLAAAAELDASGALDPAAAAADPAAGRSAAAVVEMLAGHRGVERARLALARSASPPAAEALDRLRALAGPAALVAAEERAGRVDALERAHRSRDRGDDAGAMAAYAAVVERGPQDAVEALEAEAALEEFRARGMDSDTARATADAAEAARLLQLARGLAGAFQEAAAIQRLDELLERFPASPSAAEAAALRKQLQ